MSIAVLDFENLSRDSADAYLVEGLAEELTAQLGRLGRLAVTSRSVVQRLRGRDTMSMADLGRALNARYVVVGSVRRAGPRLRVNVELLEASSGVQSWTQQFDRTESDLLEIQESIAAAVATAVAGRLLPGERTTLVARPTRHPEAYAAYLRGRSPQRGGVAAIADYQRAVELDSLFAEAWAQLAIRHARAFSLYADRTEARLALARDAAERAARLAPRSFEAHLAVGYFHFYGSRDYRRAVEQFEAAVALRPREPQVYYALATLARAQGRWDASERAWHQAIALDSADGSLYGQFGLTLLTLRRFREARELSIAARARGNESYPVLVDEVLARAGEQGGLEPRPEVLDRVIAQAPRAAGDLGRLTGRGLPLIRMVPAMAHGLLAAPAADTVEQRVFTLLGRALALAARGQAGPARAEAERLVTALEVAQREHPDDGVYLMMMAYGLSLLGRHEEAVRSAERGVALVPVTSDALQGPHRLQTLAEILVAAGQHERAIETVELLLSIPGMLSRWMLTADPVWAPLRGQARFERLITGQ